MKMNHRYIDSTVRTTGNCVVTCTTSNRVGIRAAIAPMMADTTFYQAIPCLLDSLPAPPRAHAEALQAAQTAAKSPLALVARSSV